MAKILLVEDDKELARSVSDWLAIKFHVMEHTSTIQDAGDRLAVSEFDVLILDWNLPDGTGIELLKEFRNRGGLTPAIMLTAKDKIDDKECGLSAGADDYLTKPFNLRELGARIDALLRRSRKIVPKVLTAGDLVLDPEKFLVTRGEEEIRLVPKEFALLEFLLRHPDQVFSAEALLERVWVSDTESSPDTVVTTVKRLRRKIDKPGCPSLIETVFAVGYKVSTRRANSLSSP